MAEPNKAGASFGKLKFRLVAQIEPNLKLGSTTHPTSTTITTNRQILYGFKAL